jgi:ribosomal protein S18 acetylase RimI-like enzyme
MVGHQVQIRTARREDVPAIEQCNLRTLPENYPNSFYHNHLIQWPNLALVAERVGDKLDDDRKIVGYVLGRVENIVNPYEPRWVGGWTCGGIDTSEALSCDVRSSFSVGGRGGCVRLRSDPSAPRPMR